MTESIVLRRKRLRFRSWHRGTREADLLLGRFADRHLESFSERQITAYERLLEAEDPDLWEWLVAGLPPPPGYDMEIINLLRAFRPLADPE